MKKLILLVFFLITVFSGCGSNDTATEEVRFTLKAEQQERYKSIIDETLKSFYWYYDENTFDYFESTIPYENENTKYIFEATAQNGFELKAQNGRKCVVYTVNLKHFNGNKAGTAYFYFISNSLIGAYYASADNIESAYGLSTRNTFSKDVVFSKYETDGSQVTYKKAGSTVILDGFLTETTDKKEKKLYLNISDGKLKVYRFGTDKFYLQKTVDFYSSTGMQAISATFYGEDEIAVILGTPTESEDEGGAYRIVSEKVVFLDAGYSVTGEEILLTKSSYSCVADFEDSLLLINDTSAEVYKKSEDAWANKISYNTNVQATAFKEADLDSDGSKEYILTDGKDLFIFKMNGLDLNCVWRTNISVESFYGYIYTGDINGDGVEEIYVADNTGTAIRYTLAPQGLVSKNEDIVYGDMYYVSDFNNDGKVDYIKTAGVEMPEKTLYLAQ